MLDGAGDITTFAVALVPDNELRAGLEMIVRSGLRHGR